MRNTIYETIGSYFGLFASAITIVMAFVTFFLVPQQYQTAGYVLTIGLSYFGILVVGIYVGRRITSREMPNAKSSDDILLDFFEKKKSGNENADIVRFGLALSTPVWLSHKYRTRKAIGELVEVAAINPENIQATIKVLIDDLGWTNVELGLYQEAEEKIRLGIELAEKNSNGYYAAKGFRHLFGLNYRQGNLQTCEEHLLKSKELTELLPSDKKKEELMAELHYATSSLEFKKGNLEDSLKEIDLAHEQYKHIGDREWIIKILARKGEILIGQKEYERAHQIFIKGLQISETYHFNRQIVKNLIGLGSYHLARNQVKRAQNNFEKAKEIAEIIGMYYEKRIIDDHLEVISSAN